MKLDFKDFTFMLGVKIDHPDRLENLQICVDFLRANFDTHIVIGEEGKSPALDGKFPDCTHVFIKEEADGVMRRGRLYNKILPMIKTKFIALYDVDVLFPISQFIETAEAFRADKCDMMYPYAGKFYDVPRMYKETFKKNVEDLDISKLTLNHPNSIGGAIFLKTDTFISGGGGNERVVGCGFDDDVIFATFTRLGVRISRASGHCFHLEHFRGLSAYENNPSATSNRREYERILYMNPLQLKEYVKTSGYKV